MAIVKSNKLIETSYQLGSREQFFILFLISKIDSIGDTALSEFKIHYQEIARILNFDGRKRVANSSDVFKLMDNLNSKSIRFEDDEIEGKEVWITGMQRDKKTNIYTFRINNNLKPYLIQLKQHFTKYNIQNVVHLNSHAIRMYEILKRYQYEKNGVILEVDTQIKRWLGVENKYKQYYEFKRWILLDSQKQLKKYTDIAFDFEPARKNGKSVVALKFTIYENIPTGIPKSLESLNNISIGRDRKLVSNKSYENVEKVVVEQSFTHQDKVDRLTWPQKQAYDFLSENEINKAFIISKILNHVKTKYEPIQGYEDIYIRIVWNFFKTKTTSKNLAPAFVTWWKKGRLTEENLHAKHIEEILQFRNHISEEKREQRNVAKKMTFIEYNKYKLKVDSTTQQGDTKIMENINQKFSKPEVATIAKFSKMQNLFDFKSFKEMHPKVYNDLYIKTVAEFENQYLQAGHSFDKNKFEKSILDSTKRKCEKWLETFG